MILGGGFTQTHQDGHGTVDSGHSNLSGYYEVVMLRRLPECHKLNACAHIPQLGDDCKQTDQALNGVNSDVISGFCTHVQTYGLTNTPLVT